MVYQLTVKTLLGSSKQIEFFDDVSIFELKEHVKGHFSLQYQDIDLIHNGKKLITGTLESNNVKSHDTINLSINMNAGFSLTEKYRMENLIKSYNKFQEESLERLEEIESYFSELQNTEKKESSPLEILGRMQIEGQITEDSYKDEDMRVLFQKCRDQIEDEYNKKKENEKENEKMKRKIEELKKKMKLKRQKLSPNKQKGEIKKKETFCGFKKGFLL